MKMKRSLGLLLTLVTLALSFGAQAGSLNLDSRVDSESKSYNDASNTRGYHRFNLQTLRVDGKGNFTDATLFRLRFRLNKNTTSAATNAVNDTTPYYTINAKDSLSDMVDFAFVQQKLSEESSLVLGKFGTDIGGIEGMTTNADLYFTTVAFGEQSALRYATGAKLIYTFADQELDLMVMNQESNAVSTAPSSATLNFDQTQDAVGFIYKGSFLEKTLLPVFSVHSDSVQSTALTGAAALDKKYNFYALGLKYDANPLFVELDYLMDTFKNRSVLDETDTTNTAVGTLGYKLEAWVAKLKVESTDAKIFTAATTSTKTKVNAYQLAFEYIPTGDKNYRYHVAYISRDTKPEASDSKVDQTIVAGVRLYADFLK